MKFSFALALPLLACVSASDATLRTGDRDVRIKKRFGLQTATNPSDVVPTANFSQCLDHDHPELGTFEQRYWWDATYYKPGGPIFMFNAGEQAADDYVGYVSETTMPGLYAKKFNGAAIVIERMSSFSPPPPPQLVLLTRKRAYGKADLLSAI
jgi:hypothetical protein